MAKKASEEGKRPGPRLALNRDRVLAAAVAIADEAGLGAVTMREVATRLGVEAMSLYNHVVNKDDLFDGMVDTVLGQFDLPPGAVGWREGMRRRALSAHEVFGRHPWVPPLLDSRGSSGPARLGYYEWVLGMLMESGFSVEEAGRAFSLLDSYVYGFGIQGLNFSAGGEASAEEMARSFQAAVPAETYPHLSRMVLHAMEAGYDAEADFAFGLEIILDGLERILAARSGGDSAGGRS